MASSRRASRRALTALTLGAVITAPLTVASSASAGLADEPTVFVNELHYDDESTDSGELIEIAGPAGTDLSQWSLVLYNGSNNAPYGTARTLSGTIPDQQGGYGTVRVDYPVDGIQNGSPDGIALVNAGTVRQFLSYEGRITAVGGPADGMTSTDIGVAENGVPDGQSLQLTGTGSTYGDFTWSPAGAATAGQPNTGQTFGEGGGDPDPDPEPSSVCGDPATAIHDIQGSGATFDPAFGGNRAIEGVATSTMLGGVWVQEESSDADTDATTSEGIFVFLSGRPAPAEGSLVRVVGGVTEFGGKTQLADVTALESCGAPTSPVDDTNVSFPLEAPGDLERYEGMLVELSDELVISEYFNYDRFGEVVVGKPVVGGRLWTPTAVAEPGAEANALADEYDRRTVTIDDASTTQNPSSLRHPGNGQPFSLDNRFRGGDTITGIRGILDEAFSAYRLQPTDYGVFTVKNPRPAEAPEVGGDVKVASFNVLNYFLTLDQGTNKCGPERTQDCRGANDEAELERQRAKILAALAELDADVVGLMEMENTTGVEPAADLVAGLNDMLGAGTYDYVDTGVVGTDAIRLGFLYKPGSVTPAGDTAVLDSSVDPRFDDAKNRPMLTQTFDTAATGGGAAERFTVSVNHLKSKGSDCNDVGDPDAGDGQGNCNGTRTEAARAIVDHLAGDPTGSGDLDHLVIGDLNSYDHEDPIRALEQGGFADQVKRFGGELAYGYVFDGMAGYLDHALANSSLAGQVTGTAEWHINADEPDVLDYDTAFQSPEVNEIYAPDAYRSSDHDPVLVGLELVGSELSVKVGPGKIEAGRTRPVVEAEVEAADGDRVDDGLVSVYDGDRLLGALAPRDGRVRIPLAPFDEAGPVTLTVRYAGGSASEAEEEVTVEVRPAKP